MTAEPVDERTVEQIYEESIRRLPAAGRLRLASLILNGIPPDAVIDDSDDWSDDDLRDFTNAGWKDMQEAVGGGEDA